MSKKERILQLLRTPAKIYASIKTIKHDFIGKLYDDFGKKVDDFGKKLTISGKTACL